MKTFCMTSMEASYHLRVKTNEKKISKIFISCNLMFLATAAYLKM